MLADLVSIIVPVYNVEAYLSSCISSILRQTYPKIELILVDDASTDRSGGICEEWAKKDARIQVIHQEHGGLSQARNTGIERAAGDWILYVDSDDMVHPELVKRCLETAQNTQADIVVFDYKSIEAEEEDPAEENREQEGQEPPVELYSGEELLADYIRKGTGSTAVWNKLYRRSQWETLRFPVGRLFEDTYVITDIWRQAERAAYRKEVFYYYRQREGSITHSVTIEGRYDILEALRLRCISLSDREDLYPLVLTGYLQYIIVLYQEEKERSKQKRLLGQFREIWPGNGSRQSAKRVLGKSARLQMQLFSFWPKGCFRALQIYGACCRKFPVISRWYHKLIRE